MYIQGQDKNVIFALTDKGLMKGLVYTEDVYVNGKYYGANVYGKSLLRTCLLGTYEEDEAEQVVGEIYKLLKSGAQFYAMPCPTMDLEDLGVSL
jgi:hypothetical protein